MNDLVDGPAEPVGSAAPAQGDQAGREPPAAPAPKTLKERPVLLFGGIAVVVVGVLVAFFWWLHARHYESTDDAYADARVVRVAPQIAGRVISVHVEDNQLVQVGQLIAEIDAADARAHVDQLSAQIAQARADLSQAEAQVAVSRAEFSQAEAGIAAAQAQSENAASTLARYRSLQASAPQAVAQGQLDDAVAAARNLAAQRDAARRQAAGAAARITAAETQLESGRAKIASLEAQGAQSRLSLGYTRVVAPVEGHIAQRTVAVGSYVSPGQALLAIVPRNVWVTANFKETQLPLMRVGQQVTVTVDACPAANIRGHVDSIQRGSGSAFDLLPPENATGNFVKVVQRVPVKIVLEQIPEDCPLGPGMSVEPSVKVR